MMKKGFTLVELLAVIVILAVILVIAVPKITDTINSTKEASMKSSVQMVAAQAETQYSVAQTLGNTFTTAAGTACGDWAGLNETDYDTCTYGINTGTGVATVIIKGKAGGKFENWSTTGCTGTRASVTCTANS